jgi:hypothetical protein
MNNSVDGAENDQLCVQLTGRRKVVHADVAPARQTKPRRVSALLERSSMILNEGGGEDLAACVRK